MTDQTPTPDYDAGDIAEVEGRVAVYMPNRWEWLDGTWTAIPLGVGPVLGNVYQAAQAARKRLQAKVDGPVCQACGVELSDDGACWWCDDGPEPITPLPPGSDGGVS